MSGKIGSATSFRTAKDAGVTFKTKSKWMKRLIDKQQASRNMKRELDRLAARGINVTPRLVKP